MKIIILEGIATSGKTSLINELEKFLSVKGFKYSTVTEEKTLMPILENEDREVSIEFLEKIIEKNMKKGGDFIIFDRLFFTHIFRTGSTLNNFLRIEKMLERDSLLVFLRVDEGKISERIERARKERGKEWDEYIDKKGSDQDIFRYYKEQQKFLADLVAKTGLEKKIFNTSEKTTNEIATELIQYLIQ